jgi:hypothetical protein
MSNLQKSGTRRTLTHCSAFSINSSLKNSVLQGLGSEC